MTQTPLRITTDTSFVPDADLGVEEVTTVTGHRFAPEDVAHLVDDAHRSSGRPSLSASGEPWTPSGEARRLTPSQRATLGQLIKTIVTSAQQQDVARPAQKSAEGAVTPTSAWRRRMIDYAMPVEEAACGTDEPGLNTHSPKGKNP